MYYISSSLFHSKPVWLANLKEDVLKNVLDPIDFPCMTKIYFVFHRKSYKFGTTWGWVNNDTSFSKLNLAAKQQWEKKHPVLYFHIPTLSFIAHTMSSVCRLCWEQTGLLWRPYNDCLNLTQQQMRFSASCIPPTAPTPELSDAKR